MKNASEADTLNAETKGNLRSSNGGGIATIVKHSIRKRGYHRALKRGEYWAWYEKAVTDLTNGLGRIMYTQEEQTYELGSLSKGVDNGNA